MSIPFPPYIYEVIIDPTVKGNFERGFIGFIAGYLGVKIATVQSRDLGMGLIARDRLANEAPFLFMKYLGLGGLEDDVRELDDEKLRYKIKGVNLLIDRNEIGIREDPQVLSACLKISSIKLLSSLFIIGRDSEQSVPDGFRKLGLNNVKFVNRSFQDNPALGALAGLSVLNGGVEDYLKSCGILTFR